jgi:hypothetical protein
MGVRTAHQQVKLQPACVGHASCREEQALTSGAILVAVLEEGQGDDSPQNGDLVRPAPRTPGALMHQAIQLAMPGLHCKPGMHESCACLHWRRALHERPLCLQVYVHYSIRNVEDELLYSTRSDEGGSGQAFAFVMEKGLRVPRGWELVLRGEQPVRHGSCPVLG